jgi:hypothetical protein
MLKASWLMNLGPDAWCQMSDANAEEITLVHDYLNEKYNIY